MTDGSHGWAPAIPDDGVVDDEPIRRCIEAARTGQFSGVYLPPSQYEAAFLSAAHTKEDVQKTIVAAKQAFAMVAA